MLPTIPTRLPHRDDDCLASATLVMSSPKERISVRLVRDVGSISGDYPRIRRGSTDPARAMEHEKKAG